MDVIAPAPGGQVRSAADEHKDRLLRMAVRKRSAELIATTCAGLSWPELLRAEKQRRCGSRLAFRRLVSQPAGRVHLAAANFCSQSLTCPQCAHYRAVRHLASYARKVAFLLEANPSWHFYLGTYTVPNSPDLAVALDALEVGYQNLRQRMKDARRGKGRALAGGVLGMVASVEVKRGSRRGEWHPHLHALLACSSRMDFTSGRRDWMSAAAGARNCRFSKCGIMGTVLDDCAEVLKYSVDFDSCRSADVVWSAARCLRGRKLLRATGVFRGVRVPAAVPDEGSPDWSAEPFYEWAYRWLDSRYGLLHRSRSDRVEAVAVAPGAEAQPEAKAA